jgi:hypothetical protein
MRYLLLTGAGFSRNWGGWLADEAFEYLLGCAEVTLFIRQQLWKTKGSKLGFEDTLREFRELHANSQNDDHLIELQAFETMLEGMFHTMRIGFQNSEFEPGLREARIGPNQRPFAIFCAALMRFSRSTKIHCLNKNTPNQICSKARMEGGSRFSHLD